MLRSLVLLPILLAAIPLAAADGEPRTLAVPEGRHVLGAEAAEPEEWIVLDLAAFDSPDLAAAAEPDPAQALRQAASDGDRAEVARLLLSRGVPVDVGNAQRTTPLAWALEEGSTETALVLLDAGAELAREDENDFSALDMVEYLEDEELRRRILEAADR